MDELAEKRVGTTLCNKWTLERLLGTGGMAAVYLAVHKIGRRDAIKILHAEIAKQKDLRARFEQEAHAANRFRHPGAVEIRDIDVAEDGAPFLVMELLEGESLTAYANRTGGNVPIDTVLGWMDQVLDVLAAAHAQGIIHRDVKLDNLFLQTDGRLKVLDFGIARIRDGARLLHTQWGVTLGTTPYMPPEQAQGLEVDARADLFSVAATMFRLFAKRRIHDAPGEAALLAKMATEAAPSLASVAPSVPPNVAMLVDRGLAFLRDRRYPDALTMQADVRAVREGKEPPFAKARLLAGEQPLVVGVVATGRPLPGSNAPTRGGSRDLLAGPGDEPTAASSRMPAQLDEATRLPPTTREAPQVVVPPQVIVPPPVIGAPHAVAPQAVAPSTPPPPSQAVTAAGFAPVPAASPLPTLPPVSMGQSTLRSEALDPSALAPPPSSFGAPSIRVIEAPPLSGLGGAPMSAVSPSLARPASALVVPLLLVGLFFCLVGAGVVLLLGKGSDAANPSPSASAPPALSAAGPVLSGQELTPAVTGPAKAHPTAKPPPPPPPPPPPGKHGKGEKRDKTDPGF